MGGTMMPSPRASNAAPGVASGSPARKCLAEASGGLPPKRRSAWTSVTHFPDLVMPMGTTSNFFLSMALSTEAADRSETSCSPLRPPKSTPIFNFFIFSISCFHFKVKPIYHGDAEARRDRKICWKRQPLPYSVLPWRVGDALVSARAGFAGGPGDRDLHYWRDAAGG